MSADSASLPIPTLPSKDVPVIGPESLEISESTYEWSVRLFSVFRKLLRVKLELHDSGGRAERGEIFLFNHFSRFETFIPQYLLYQATGSYSRAVASAEFFENPDDPLASYLSKVGAVPNSLPNLLPYLAAEILRGRKIVVFPEGGMVKDRRVVDADGEYRVYSRTAEVRRKHHSGAAVLALALDAFRGEVLRLEREAERGKIEDWAGGLDMTSEALVRACARSTTIVPANITFYPIRVSENLLSKAAEMLGEGLSPRMTEELLVEGNLLLRDTDMDIRLGEPLLAAERWRGWERRLLSGMTRKSRVNGLDDFFKLQAQSRLVPRMLAGRMKRKVAKLRDGYMHGMYRAVTVNLSHLASRIVLVFAHDGLGRISRRRLFRVLYLAIKELQNSSTIYLHDSLMDPAAYQGLLDGGCVGIDQFLHAKTTMALLEEDDDGFRFLPKLHEEHEFDEIRLENLIAVYANEVEPIEEVSKAVATAIKKERELTGPDLARAMASDALREYQLDKDRDLALTSTRDAELPADEIATETGEPYFSYQPGSTRDIAVLVVHGFLASPAEVRGFARHVADAGYPVFSVRLRGHGTSPWDLREQPFEAWLESVKAGYRLLREVRERVVIVGFSTGGALALRLAAERPPGLAGVGAVAAPLKFQNRAMVFVPLVHRANALVRWASNWEGVMPFRVNESENPHINYRNMPIRGLHELRRLTDDLRGRLEDIETKVLVLQGDEDPVVDPESANILARRLSPERTEVHFISSAHHGILYRNTGETHATLLSFLTEIDGQRETGLAPSVDAGS